MGLFLLKHWRTKIPSNLHRNPRIPFMSLLSSSSTTPSMPQTESTIFHTPQCARRPPFFLPFTRGFAASSQPELDPQTSDGLTVDGIVARSWPILDEGESDWRSHAASVALSIQLIKRRLQWKKMALRVEQLSAELNKPDLFEDPVYAEKIFREHGMFMGKMKEVNGFEEDLLEYIDALKYAQEENDTELESDSMEALLRLRRIAKEKELEALLAGEHDSCSCFIEVQSEAGGTQSMDWAAMVMNMYKMWAQRHGFGVTTVDEMPGEIAGIKRATIKVDGEFAYGCAKSEVGVHRLERVAPSDTKMRRRTSFAAVAVIPILGDSSSRFQINESDLRIERFRSGGAGDQSVNATDSAVRIVHIPTGVTTTCQTERSLHQNKAMAMAVLQSRLDQLEMAPQAQMNAQHTESHTDISWGNQPYAMVKDPRTFEGDIERFSLSYLPSTVDKDEETNELFGKSYLYKIDLFQKE